MERYTMVLDWKTQFIKISVLPKAVLGFSAIPIELPKAIFADLVEKNLMETQKASNGQRNLDKEKWAWRNQAS